MKLSARNILSGKVVEISTGPTTTKVKIALADGASVVTSTITTDAAADLGLKVGDEVSAIIKSSDIIIGK